MLSKVLMPSAIAVAVALAVSGCISGGSSPLSGVLVDAEVEGVAYQTPSRNGVTDGNGRFEFVAGETVTFTIGGVTLGAASGATRVTFDDFSGNSDENIRRAQFVQSLDADGNPENGIQINAATRTAMNGRTLDFTKTQSAFDTDLNALATAAGTTFKNRTQALGHLRTSLAEEAKTKTLTMAFKGRFSSGLWAKSGAEIVDFDPATNRAFVVNAQDSSVDVLDLSDVTNPTRIFRINLAGEPNSVAVKNGLVAVAIANATKTDNGTVNFYDAAATDFTNPIATVNAGALPDMVTFTPDGTKVLVANEGEPNDAYTIDPEGTVSVIALDIATHGSAVAAAGQLGANDAVSVNFNAFDAQEAALTAAGVRIFGANNPTVSQDLEPEYIAVSADSSTAYVALQEANAIAVVDLGTNTVTAIHPLGVKDHSLSANSLDPSNRDNQTALRNFDNLFGMYMPDAIASYTVGDKTYIVTANEGDSRDYGGFSEEVRVKDLTLDATVFPNAAALQADAELGRLKTTTATGDTDGDNDHDQIFAYGARSFSIFEVTSNGLTLTYDSANEFESRILADANFANFFNANGDENDADARSDDKGPEPEGVVIGTVGSASYAFIGLERIGGIMVYNVSDVNDPQFVTYINSRDFTVDPSGFNDAQADDAGDISPEGLKFVSESESPTGKPLLIVGHEMSGTTAIYELTEN